MHRLLICLPICLCLGPHYQEAADTPAKPTAPRADVVKDNGTALPKPDEMEGLAKNDVLAFFEQTLRRFGREVKGYSAVLQKQEKIDGKIYPTEVIDVRVREKPYAIYMAWKSGTRQAERVLYAEGENGDKLLARPSGALARAVAGDVVSRDVEGPEARSSGRYSLKEAGLKRAAERTLVDWKAALEAGKLKVEYLGIKRVKEAGDRPCYTFRRTSSEPDKEGVCEAMIHVDTENWLQVGSVLKDQKGELLGAYYFRDVKINPEFAKEQFTRAALKP
jgi:hypothetical protein